MSAGDGREAATQGAGCGVWLRRIVGFQNDSKEWLNIHTFRSKRHTNMMLGKIVTVPVSEAQSCFTFGLEKILCFS
jgi:hypothetical protein